MNFFKTILKWLFVEKLLPKAVIGFRWQICLDCEHRRRGWFRFYCNLCMCTISPNRHALNKLAHPCQGCPINKWTKLYQIGEQK